MTQKSIAVVVDAFHPLQNSAAVQMRDLVLGLEAEGAKVTVFTPRRMSIYSKNFAHIAGLQTVIIRAAVPFLGSKFKFIRGVGELLLPAGLLLAAIVNGAQFKKWDVVICYSPSIFCGVYAASLRLKREGLKYLVVRDMFPEWAVDLGLFAREGVIHSFFSKVARFQYLRADVIGVQSPGNRKYVEQYEDLPHRRVEVLNNWLSPPLHSKASIDLSQTGLAGRKIIVYAGNMGVAQNMSHVLPVLEQFKDDASLGFLFVGSGPDVKMLHRESANRGFTNVLVHDSVPSEEMHDLLEQCFIGLVILDAEHKSHNIPGKLLTYLRAGLPVVASVNENNDLIGFINREGIGKSSVAGRAEEFCDALSDCIALASSTIEVSKVCREVFNREFATSSAVTQILQHYPRQRDEIK